MVRKEKYMNWINGFAESSFKLYAGNTIDAFQPLDFFHFYPLWYDLWVERFMRVMDVLDCENKTYQELKHLLPGPSAMRAIIQKIIPTLKGVHPEHTKNFIRMANFFARMLIEACPADPFGNTTNPLHTYAEINLLIQNTPWTEGSPEIAKQLGKLITAAGSLVHGLYNDVVTDFGWDAYGPYSLFTPGKKHQLIIRHFPDLNPSGIWDKIFHTPIHDLKIYQFYEDVEWELAYLGCHTVLKSGNPISGLRHFALEIDGSFVGSHTLPGITHELSDKAENIYKEIRKKDFEQLKEMVMVQECYQLKKMFEAAYMNWLPTHKMFERIKNTPLVTGILPLGKMMTDFEEYKEEFGINSFKKAIENETIK
jgi:hypothetical protein